MTWAGIIVVAVIAGMAVVGLIAIGVYFKNLFNEEYYD